MENRPEQRVGPRRIVRVAEHDGRLEGYGKAEWLDPAARCGDALGALVGTWCGRM